MKEWLLAILVAAIVMYSGLRQDRFSRWLSQNSQIDLPSAAAVNSAAPIPPPRESAAVISNTYGSGDRTLTNSCGDIVNAAVPDSEKRFEDTKASNLGASRDKAL